MSFGRQLYSMDDYANSSDDDAVVIRTKGGAGSEGLGTMPSTSSEEDDNDDDSYIQVSSQGKHLKQVEQSYEWKRSCLALLVVAATVTGGIVLVWHLQQEQDDPSSSLSAFCCSLDQGFSCDDSPCSWSATTCEGEVCQGNWMAMENIMEEQRKRITAAPSLRQRNTPTPVQTAPPIVRPTTTTPTRAPTAKPTAMPITTPVTAPAEEDPAAPSLLFRESPSPFVATQTPTTIPTSQPTTSPTTNSLTQVPTFHPSWLRTTTNPTPGPTMLASEQQVLVTSTPTLSLWSPYTPEKLIQWGYSPLITIPVAPSEIDGTIPHNCPHTIRNTEAIEWSTLYNATIQGDLVLPENSVVVTNDLAVTPLLQSLTIPPSSTLIVSPDTHIQAHTIVVRGNFLAGSPTCPVSDVKFTLYGKRNDNPRNDIRKAIEVQGGTLALYGKSHGPSWTRLSATAEAGDRVVWVQQALPGWQPGQEVVIVTTALFDDREWHQNEVREIVNVRIEGNATALLLSQPLEYRHVALEEYQGEVGLLSRSILVEGAMEDSHPTNPQSYDGYGAHVIVNGAGVAKIDSVEFRRVGQTNRLGRYPVHFHLLGDTCPECFLTRSSIHESFFRGVVVHGSHHLLVSENVAFNVTGHCFYLEDGVETNNTISYNLAAHIHMILPDGMEPPTGQGQITPIYTASENLIQPADTVASGFYTPNLNNRLVGNSASGGWSGFAFPVLPEPTGDSQNVNYRPLSAPSLRLDGNTAHSTGWWWKHAGAFYFGGTLWKENGVTQYNPGRDMRFSRNACSVDVCVREAEDCTVVSCPSPVSIRLTNSKAFLVANIGMNSWQGSMDFVGYESHDNGMSLQALSSGFWCDQMLGVCRTGEPLALPDTTPLTSLSATGLFWYDTQQEHILTNIKFQNCGYDVRQTGEGCLDCSELSTVFGFLSHSDRFNPEVMQATSNIEYENCGRRFYQHHWSGDSTDTVSGRLQNWIDVDGSASGLNEPAFIVSGHGGPWWDVDDNVQYSSDGPVRFIPKEAEHRNLGHVRFSWDPDLHDQVGQTICGTGTHLPCETQGVIRHIGFREGLPMKALGDVVGLTGGFGWYMQLNNGAPKQLSMEFIEVDPDSVLLFSMAYPIGTSFEIKAKAQWCNTDFSICEELFQSVSSVQQVRESLGNTYHVSDDGVLTIRIIQTAQTSLGTSEWMLPTWDTEGIWGGLALDRFERGGIRLPVFAYGPSLVITADCAGGGRYCNFEPPTEVWMDATVCSNGFIQSSYDTCCRQSDDSFDKNDCVYANGQVK